MFHNLTEDYIDVDSARAQQGLLKKVTRTGVHMGRLLSIKQDIDR